MTFVPPADDRLMAPAAMPPLIVAD